MKPTKIIDHVTSLDVRKIMDYKDAKKIIEREVARGKIPREMRHDMTNLLYNKAFGWRNTI